MEILDFEKSVHDKRKYNKIYFKAIFVFKKTTFIRFQEKFKYNCFEMSCGVTIS